MLNDLNIKEQSLISKIKMSIDRNDAKILHYLKNSKTTNDSLSMLHHAAKNYRPKTCELLIDDINIGMSNVGY